MLLLPLNFSFINDHNIFQFLSLQDNLKLIIPCFEKEENNLYILNCVGSKCHWLLCPRSFYHQKGHRRSQSHEPKVDFEKYILDESYSTLIPNLQFFSLANSCPMFIILSGDFMTGDILPGFNFNVVHQKKM